jgi:hypothetical protein
MKNDNFSAAAIYGRNRGIQNLYNQKNKKFERKDNLYP